jgi:hypothetical protein
MFLSRFFGLRHTQTTRPYSPRRRPQVESLEGRQLLTALTLTSPELAGIIGNHAGTNVAAIQGQHIGTNVAAIQGQHIGTNVAAIQGQHIGMTAAIQGNHIG